MALAFLSLPVRAVTSSRLALVAKRVFPQMGQKVAGCIRSTNLLWPVRSAVGSLHSSTTFVKSSREANKLYGAPEKTEAVPAIRSLKAPKHNSVVGNCDKRSQQSNILTDFYELQPQAATGASSVTCEAGMSNNGTVLSAAGYSPQSHLAEKPQSQQRKILVYQKEEAEATEQLGEPDLEDSDVIVSIRPYVIYKDGPEIEDEFQGYAIKTNKQTIRLVISRWTSCCEEFGVYLNSQKDNTQVAKAKDLVGAKVLKVRWGRDKPDGHKEPAEEDIDWDDYPFEEPTSYACVDVFIDKGKVQLVAWNRHDGPYPHTVIATWSG